MAEPEWMQEVRALVGKEYGRVYAWDPVNAPMIRQWCELMGTEVPYDEQGQVLAPPAMLQVWCMEGPVANNYPPGSTTENPYEALKLIEAQGFPSVVAVNSELTFERYLREGEPAGMSFLEWTQSPAYDPAGIKADFRAMWWGGLLTEGVLRRE